MSDGIPIRIWRQGRLWRLSSADGRLGGVFVDRRAAERHAIAEAQAHEAYLCAFRR